MFTSQSICPYSLSAEETISWSDASLVTSVRVARAVPPAAAISPRTACAGIEVAIGNDDRSPALREALRDGSAHACTRAGHDRDAALALRAGHLNVFATVVNTAGSKYLSAIIGFSMAPTSTLKFVTWLSHFATSPFS